MHQGFVAWHVEGLMGAERGGIVWSLHPFSKVYKFAVQTSHVDDVGILRDVGAFFARFTPTEFRALSDDKAVRMVKTVLHTLCKFRGWPLLDTVKSMPELTGEGQNGAVLKYVQLNLQHLSSNRLLPGQENAAATAVRAPLAPIDMSRGRDAAVSNGALADPAARSGPAGAVNTTATNAAQPAMQGGDDTAAGAAPASGTEPAAPAGSESAAAAAEAGGEAGDAAEREAGQPLQPIHAENAGITSGLNVPEQFSPLVRCSSFLTILTVTGHFIIV
jgi:hypothetical protein